MRYFAIILLLAFVAQPSYQREFDDVEYMDSGEDIKFGDDIEVGPDDNLEKRSIGTKGPLVPRPVPERTSGYNPEVPLTDKYGPLAKPRSEEEYSRILEEVIRDAMTPYTSVDRQGRKPSFYHDLSSGESRNTWMRVFYPHFHERALRNAWFPMGFYDRLHLKKRSVYPDIYSRGPRNVAVYMRHQREPEIIMNGEHRNQLGSTDYPYLPKTPVQIEYSYPKMLLTQPALTWPTLPKPLVNNGEDYAKYIEIDESVDDQNVNPGKYFDHSMGKLTSIQRKQLAALIRAWQGMEQPQIVQRRKALWVY